MLNEAYATSFSAYPMDFSCLFFTLPASPGERQNKEIDSHRYSEQHYTAFTIGQKLVVSVQLFGDWLNLRSQVKLERRRR